VAFTLFIWAAALEAFSTLELLAIPVAMDVYGFAGFKVVCLVTIQYLSTCPGGKLLSPGGPRSSKEIYILPLYNTSNI
jgi:hypothetical protein